MDNINDKMLRATQVRDAETVQRVKQHKEKSRTKLTQVVERKCKTIFIGAISAIEEEFGFLWGRDKSPNERTEQEQEWYDAWQRVRTTILNNGNNQARAIINELQQYEVAWQGYKLKLSVEQDNGKNSR